MPTPAPPATLPPTLLHADLYRLDRLSDVVDLGLAEMVEDDAVAVVEWGDVAEPVLGGDALSVRLGPGHGRRRAERDDHRRRRGRGPRRRDALAGLLVAVGGAMIVLAVESATELAGVALADEAGVLGVRRGRRAVGATPRPSPRPSNSVCRRTGVALADLDAVGVDVGPGLFTGLRVGVGTAKALAFALDRPRRHRHSLEVLAHAVAASGAADGRLVVPVVDARRGEVFAARFRRRRRDRRSGVGVRRRARRRPRRWPPSLRAGSEPSVLAGDGALRYRGAPGGASRAVTLAGPASTPPRSPPWPRCAVAAPGPAGSTTAADVMPRYLRDADARINWETAPRRAGGAPAAAAGVDDVRG